MAELKKDDKGRVVDIEFFRTKFKNRIGTPDRRYEVPQESIEKYKDILPKELMYYWETHGFSSFLDGLFWLTDPDEYTQIVQEYLKGTPYENRKDLYVIFRSAFGKLYIWESTKGRIIKIYPLLNMIFFSADADREKLNKEDENFVMNRLLGVQSPRSLEEDDASSKPLFARCLKKFGKVEKDEMYGYKLSHLLGGKESIKNIDRMNLFNHISIQKQLKEPTISISDMENNTLTY